MSTLTLALSDEDVARIAEAVAARLAPKEELVSVAEAARRLGISARSAWRQVAVDRLRAVKVGGRTLVTTESIDRLMEAAG